MMTVVLQIGLSKFKVKKGKSYVVDEWMAFLNDHLEEVLLTLKDEKMYVEQFSVKKTGKMTISISSLSKGKAEPMLRSRSMKWIKNI
jgi:hypothetical protein